MNPMFCLPVFVLLSCHVLAITRRHSSDQEHPDTVHRITKRAADKFKLDSLSKPENLKQSKNSPRYFYIPNFSPQGKNNKIPHKISDDVL